jgi:cobalt-zinc-cadmium efflux system membrane fusion protein
MSKGKAFFLAAALALAVGLLAGCGGQQAGPGDEEETGVPVAVAAAELGVLDDATTITGKLEALESARVVPSGAGGKVARVNVDIGDRVARGQALVELENNLQAAGVNQAEAAVVMAESQLRLAETNYKMAAANYERGKMLFQENALAKAQFESQYELPYIQARESFEKTAPAGLNQARAGLKSAREAYEQTIIKSPLSGVVTARGVNPGEMASAAMPVLTVVNLDKVVVRANVSETQVNELKKNQEVMVKISAVAGEPLTGVITNIALASDPQTRAYPVKIQIDNPERLLKPGMFAEVQLAREREESLLVPREAVLAGVERTTVWVVKDGTAKVREVTVGPSDGKLIVVTSGLEAGEQVVISGQDNLSDGDAVRIVG